MVPSRIFAAIRVRLVGERRQGNSEAAAFLVRGGLNAVRAGMGRCFAAKYHVGEESEP